MQTTDVDLIGPLPALEPGLGRDAQPAPRTEARTERPEPKAPEPVDPKLLEAVQRLHHEAVDPNIRIGFFKIEGSLNPVIRVYNKETGEVVRQIPEDEVLRLRERFAEFNGFLADRLA